MTNKNLADKAVSIKGKSYVQVKDRIQFLSDNYDGRYSLESSYEYIDSRKMWIVKATLTIRDEKHEHCCVYNGLAQEIESSDIKKVNFSSALENAETSAWGRCAAAFGLGIDATGGIASANEMEKALNRQRVIDEVVEDGPFTDTPSNPEPSWFEKAKSNIKFMQECLDEEDYIAKAKKRATDIGAKMTKQQETDLRICYKNAKAMENLPTIE